MCVSEEFNLTRLLKEIISAINSKRCDDLSSDTLQTSLRTFLQNNKFLLVLNEVWNEDSVKWIELRNLLMSMGSSSDSKIIVTTRTSKVHACEEGKIRV